ncbi:MAG: DUF4239 domain-containing protein [Chthoniobacterales bacterium]|nr:DUF4239 domain-containing protein [Chthoniobacterales bacterium]
MIDNGGYEIFNINPLVWIRVLDAMPFPKMVLIVVGAILVLSTLIVFLTYLVRGKNAASIPDSAALANDMNAAIFGLILAFLVVSMYDTNRRVEESISKEANSLVAILQTSRCLNNAPEIRAAIKNYAQTVIEKEWPLMQAGKIEEVWALAPSLMSPVMEAVLHANPMGTVQEHFFDKLPEMLRDLDGAHRSRLTQSELHLPVQFWRVIVLMMILTLWFLAYMNPWTGIGSMIPIVIPGIVIALSFSLLISLHYPFLGPFSVSNKPFSLGELQMEGAPMSLPNAAASASQ